MHYGCYEMCTFKITADFSFIFNFSHIFQLSFNIQTKKKNHTNHLQQPQHITLDLFNRTTVLGKANCTDP